MVRSTSPKWGLGSQSGRKAEDGQAAESGGGLPTVAGSDTAKPLAMSCQDPLSLAVVRMDAFVLPSFKRSGEAGTIRRYRLSYFPGGL